MRFKRKYLSIPYMLFLVCFVIIPVLFIVYYAFTNKGGSFTFDNLQKFFSDKTNVDVLLISFVYAILNTIICIIIGYPLAMILANKNGDKPI